MNSMLEECFYLKVLSDRIEAREFCSVYELKQEYGDGTFSIYNILPGLNMSYSCYEVNKTILNEDGNFQEFSKPVIKINYCLDGKTLIYDINGKGCVAGKSSTSYLTGCKNMYSVEHFNKNYRCITLFGYLEDIKKALKNDFNIEEDIITKFCSCIDRDTEYIALDTDNKAKKMLNELVEGVVNSTDYVVKLRAIELFIHEVMNIGKFRRKVVYINRDTAKKLKNIRDYITKNLEEDLGIKMLSEKFNISVDSLKRGFRQLYNESVYAFIKKRRLYRGKELLETSDFSVIDIAFLCGYNSHHSFSNAFKNEFKLSPRELRKSATTV